MFIVFYKIWYFSLNLLRNIIVVWQYTLTCHCSSSNIVLSLSCRTARPDHHNKEFFSSAWNGQKSTEILRNSRMWSVLWDFLVGMEFDRLFQFCSKSPEIARNFEKLQKVISFVGFPGRDGIRLIFSVLFEISRNQQKSAGILRSSKKWSILWDFLVGM